jgi:hypothetical protein
VLCLQKKLKKGRVGVALVGFADRDRSTPGIRRSPSTALRALAFGHRQGTMTVCGAAVIAPAHLYLSPASHEIGKAKAHPYGQRSGDRDIG